MTTAAPGSGLGSVVGSGIEGSYGTLATIDKWHALDSFEVKQQPVHYKGQALHGGALARYDAETVKTNQDATGSFKMPFYFNGMGRFVGALMGSLATPPVQNMTTTSYTQTAAYGSAWGQSLSFQQVIPDISQTAHVWNVYGAKITDGQFECTAGNPLLATFSVDAQDRYEVASGAAITAPGGAPFFAWQHMSVKVGTLGSEAKVDGVSKWSASIKRAMDVARYNAGNISANPSSLYGIKDEPVDNAYADITGTLETEYLNDTLFENYYQTDTPFSLVVAFTAVQVAATGYPYSVAFNFPRCRFLTGEDPSVSGPGIVKPSMAYEAMGDGTHPVCSIVYTNTDATL